MDNQSLGQTPIIRDVLKAGTHTLKISSNDSSILPWEGQITLNPGVVTVVDRQLSADPNQTTGYLLGFEKLSDKNTAEVSIITTQENVSVAVDGNPAGFTPFKSSSVNAGAHTFFLSSPGFQDKSIKATVQAGYRLIISAQLAAQTIVPTPTISLTPSPTATPSGKPTPTLSVTTLPKQSTSSAVTKPYVEILSTPTGWLKVRATGDPNGAEIAKVNPGDKYPYLDTNSTGWVEIEYATDKPGWVSGSYVKVVK